MLSDRDLTIFAKEHLLVDPFIEANCEGATINLTLAPIVKKYSSEEPITLFEEIPDERYQEIDIGNDEFYLQPSESVLAHTIESVNVPPDAAGKIYERYSIKSTGLMVSPAGYMNPGYKGKVGFLIVNHAPVPVRLVHGVKICQLSIVPLSSPSSKPYEKQASKYMDDPGASISKLHLDQEVKEFLGQRGVAGVSGRTVKELGDYLVARVKKSGKTLADILRSEES